MSTTRFRIGTHVIHEVIEGEAVIIDLTSGAYYSLDEVGAQVWEWLGAGATRDQVVDLVHERYDAPRETVDQAVRAMIDELVAENLAVPDDREGGPMALLQAGENKAEVRRPFTPPHVAKYTDMQDLILLDPVHEVEPTAGWPLPADANQRNQP